MELITYPTNWANGYSPAVSWYTQIYSDLTGGERGISVSSMTAYAITNTSLTAREIKMHHVSFTGNSTTINGYGSISGYKNVSYYDLWKEASWVASSADNSTDWSASTYAGAMISSIWSYNILDSASASVSGAVAYASDYSGKIYYGTSISTYPLHDYFTVSAVSWNIDSANLLNEGTSIIVVRVGGPVGTPYIYALSRETNNLQYYWSVDLKTPLDRFHSGDIIYWTIEARETWGAKTTYGASGQFTFKGGAGDNSASGNTYGGARGTDAITGTYSAVIQSLGKGDNWSWETIGGKSW